MISLAEYRRKWPRIGGVLALVLGGVVALTHRKMPKSQILATLNFGALLLHQYEEYEYPGYFPGQLNRGMLRSEKPDRYPLNTSQAMVTNTVLAYPFYILPVIFPNKKWLGIGPVLVGFAQSVFHGIVIPVRAKARYGPGFLSAICLHMPLGIGYLRALKSEGSLARCEWARGRLYAVAFVMAGVPIPMLLMSDKDSRYRFTPRQMGRYGVRK